MISTKLQAKAKTKASNENNVQMLDLVTMEPKLAGELTAAEKYIIKSRLRSVSPPRSSISS